MNILPGRKRHIARLAFSKSFSLLLFYGIQSLLARSMHPSAYGEWELLLAQVTTISSFMIFGLDSGMGRFIYEVEENSRKSIVGLFLFLQIIPIIVGCCILFLLKYFEGADGLGAANGSVIFILTACIFNVIIDQTLNIWLWLRRTALFSLLAIMPAMFFLVGILGLFASASDNFWDIQKLFFVYLFSRASVAFISIVVMCCFQVSKWPSAKEAIYIPAIAKYSVPLGITVVIASMIPLQQKELLDSLYGGAVLGYFSFAFRICSVILILRTALSGYIVPSLMNKLPSGELNVDSRVTLVLASIAAALALAVSVLVSPHLIFFLGGAKFLESTSYILPLSVAFSLSIVEIISTIGLDLKKVSWPYLLSNCMICIWFLLAGLWLEPLGSPLILAWSIPTVYFLRFILLSEFSYNLINVESTAPRAYLVACLPVLALAIVNLVDFESFALGFGINVAIVILSSIFLLSTLTPKELTRLHSLVIGS